jgi:prophage antirepressor-like protein
MNDLITLNEHSFNFNNLKVKIIMDVHNNPWFNGKDVAESLGYKDANDALLSRVSAKYKKSLKELLEEVAGESPATSFTHNEGRAVYINEAGVYSLIFSSKLKIAEQFREIVFEQILPSIRKTGEFKLTQELKLLKDKEENLLLQLEEKDDIILKHEHDAKFMQEISKNKVDLFPHEKTGNSTIYGASTNKNKKDYLSKIGKGEDDRLSQLNTSHPNSDPLEFDTTLIVHDKVAYNIEQFIHCHLDPFRLKNKSKKTKRNHGSQEWFMIHQRLVKIILRSVVNLSENLAQLVNRYIKLLEDNNRNYDVVENLLDEILEEFINAENIEMSDEEYEEDEVEEKNEEEYDSGSDDEIGIQKNCNKCRLTKNLSKFNYDYSRGDNHEPICKECKHINYKKYKEKNPEKFEKIECPYCLKLISPTYFRHGHQETVDCVLARRCV